jgi:hypothetical protein
MSRKNSAIKSLAWTKDCIFCGKPADSEEDAHPKWLIKWLKDNKRIDPADADSQRLPILELQKSHGGTVQAHETSKDFKVGIMCVCQECNNGWMSVIQNTHGKPVLTQILEEPSSTLDIDDCRSVALWGVMTSMVLDFLNEELTSRQFTEVERCIFWKTLRIPDNVFVWIGPWINSTGPTYGAHLLARNLWAVDGVLSTFGFESVAMQVVKLIAGPLPKPRLGPWDQALLQVFPMVGRSLAFPTRQAINGEDGFEQLEMRFSPSGADSGRIAADEALKRSNDLRRKKSPQPGQSQTGERGRP